MLLKPFADFPAEGAIIGRILAGYSEIQYDLCTCLGAALGNHNASLRTLYRLRGEDMRVQVADALMREPFQRANLKNEYEAALGAIRWCKSLRNQYAHCHWWAQQGQGLFFADLEKAAKTSTGEVGYQFLNVDVPLLTLQEDYLDYTDRWITFLTAEFERRAGRRAIHTWQAPKIIEPPPLHNPPETHPLRLRGPDNLPPQPEEPGTLAS